LLISLLNSVFKLGGNVSKRLAFVSKTAPVFLANNLLRVFLPDAGGPIIMVAEAFFYLNKNSIQKYTK